MSPAPVRQRWALLIGISGYAHESLRLQCAARDAQRLRDVLLQPTAGSFAVERVLLLSDDQATLAGLTKALRTFLKRPAVDDLVLLFFACHGAHDPERPGNLYLLPHDTDPADISGTALPMREIDLALKETLVSRHVVVLMDSCHSGGIGGGFRAHDAAAADFNRYMAELSDARGGVSVLTSAMANEGAHEGAQWGQGHGVFTHFVLEGLKGKADAEPRDGFITVGKLFDYVSRQVKQATGDRQHPHMSGSSDRELVLAVMGASNAQEHLQMADALASAAQWLEEPICWLGAAAQRQQAQRLAAAGDEVALATTTALELARGGDLEAAQACLRELPRDQGDVRALLGLAELAQGRFEDARGTLLAPNDAAPWVQRLFARSTAPGRRVTLLVATDSVDPAAYGGWSGELKSPVAEARAFGDLLHQSFGFDETIQLFDRQATRNRLQSTLGELLARSSELESLVLLLSGHGGKVVNVKGGGGRDGTFCCFDGQILAAELDAALRRSQAGRTTLVVSAAHSGHFVERASGGYDAMASCGPDQVDYETGPFSNFALALLDHLKPDVGARALAAAVTAAVEHKAQEIGTRQVPVFSLAPDEPPLLLARRRGSALPATAMARTLLGSAAASDAELDIALAWLAEDGAGIERFAAALVAPAGSREALLPRLASLPSPSGMSNAQASVIARALARQAELAGHPVLDCLGSATDDPQVQSALQEIRRATASGGSLAHRLQVLLIGAPDPARAAGSDDAARTLAAVCAALQVCGVPAARITTLSGAAASARRVRETLERLRGEPLQSVLVYWFGSGRLASMRCHGREAMAASEIAALAPGATLLAEGIADSTPLERGDAGQVLALTVLLGAAPYAVESEAVLHKPRGRRRRAITPVAAALLAALQGNGHDLAALRVKDLETGGTVRCLGPRSGGETLIANPIADAVDALAARLRTAELEAAARLLDDWLEVRSGTDGMLQLQLGVLRDALGQTDAALAALERAIELLTGQAGQVSALARARLMLGRVLLASGRDRARAVSECRLAGELDPQLDAALYWRGRAIAELIRQETRAEASEALTTYLSRGATIGRRQETLRLLQVLAEASR